MLIEFIFGGAILIGSVDLVEEEYAVVEYFYNEGEDSSYRVVKVDENFCIPYEGQTVIFNDYKIIGCKEEYTQ